MSFIFDINPMKLATDLMTSGFKGFVGLTMALIAWFSSQIYFGLMGNLQELKEISFSTEKRITAIETARALYTDQWFKQLNQLDDLQKTVDRNTREIQLAKEILLRHKMF